MRHPVTIARIAATAVVGTGLLAAAGSTTAGAASDGPGTSIGALLYLAPSGALDVVNVSASGATSVPRQVGPVSTATGSQKLSIFGLTASGDGRWAAWSEIVTISSSQPDVSDRLVVRNNLTGQELSLNSADEPVGFAGDRLIVTSGLHAFELVRSPHPHLVSIHDSAEPLATYRHGIIDEPLTFPKHGSSYYEHIRLRSLGGHKRTLYTYTNSSHSLRSVQITASSADSKRVVVERGDHTDFGGVGPSSIVDEFSLTGAAHHHRLGHYGSTKAQWRVWNETFVGPHDHVWVTWYRSSGSRIVSRVTRYAHGHWELVAPHAVTAAGNLAGYAVVQPGRFAPVPDANADEHEPTPTGDAILVHHGHSHALAVQGRDFVWISR